MAWEGMAVFGGCGQVCLVDNKNRKNHLLVGSLGLFHLLEYRTRVSWLFFFFFWLQVHIRHQLAKQNK